MSFLKHDYLPVKYCANFVFSNCNTPFRYFVSNSLSLSKLGNNMINIHFLRSSQSYKMSKFVCVNVKCLSQILIHVFKKYYLTEMLFFLSKYSEPDPNMFQRVFRFKNLLLIIKIINKCIVKTFMNYDLHQFIASK